MYDEESERFMSEAATFAHSFIHEGNYRNWSPDLARFFSSYRQKLPVWDVCGFLWHRFQLPHPDLCAACKYRYAGHVEGIRRGRSIMGMGKVMTMGEAVEAAIAKHAKVYPGSAVYSAEVSESHFKTHTHRVEVRADHFSVPLTYLVP